jgi:hypothetical protein
MGLMKEKLEAVMNEWEKGDEMQTNKEVPLSKKIIDYVLKNQNSTAFQINNHIMRTYPDTHKANISSILKQLSDRNHLEREEHFDSIVHRLSYKYRVPSEARKQELQKARKAENKASKERLTKMRAQAEAARAAKVAKKEERLKAQEHVGTGGNTGLSDLLPSQATAHLLRPIEIPPYDKDPQVIIRSLSVMQARALYDELKNIFGG